MSGDGRRVPSRGDERDGPADGVGPEVDQRDVTPRAFDDRIDRVAEGEPGSSERAVPAEEHLVGPLLLDDLEDRRPDVGGDDRPGPQADVHLLGDVVGVLEEVALVVEAVGLDVLQRGRLGPLDDVDRDELGRPPLGVRTGGPGCEPEQPVLGRRVGDRDDHPVGLGGGPADRVAKEALLDDAAPRVGGVPDDPEADDARADQDDDGRHLGDDHDAQDDAEDGHRGVENRRQLERRVVLVRIGASEDDEGDVHQEVGDEEAEAGRLGQQRDDRLDAEADRDQEGRHAPGRHDRAVGRVEALVAHVEPVAHEAVTAHGIDDARGGEDRGVRARDRGDDRGEGDTDDADRPHRDRGHVGDGDRRVGEDLDRDGPGAHEHDEHVEAGHEDHREDHRERDDPAGVLDLAGDGGDDLEAEERDEHDAGRREHARRARGGEGRQVRGLDEEDPDRDEDHDDRRLRPDHDVLEGAGLVGPVVVDADEQREPGEAERDHDVAAVEAGDRPDDVLAEPDHVERAGEHQPGPHAPADDRPEEPAERPVDVVVAPAGDRHARRELRQRQRREQGDEPGDRIGDRTRRAGVPGGDAREDEDAGADHRPAAERHRLEEAQRPLELALAAHGGPDAVAVAAAGPLIRRPSR